MPARRWQMSVGRLGLDGEGLGDRVGLTLVRSGVRFEGKGVAVGVLKPRYASTAGARGDSLGSCLRSS